MQTTCVTPSSARRRESRDWISTRRTHVADVRRAEDGVDVVAGRARRVPGPQRPEVARARRAHRGAGRAEVGQRPQHADARLGDGRAPHEERVPDAVRARREGQREEGRVAQAVVDHEVLRDEVVVREQRVQAPEHEVPVRRREEVRVHVDAGRRVHDLARDGGDVLAADLERVVGEVHGRRGGLGRGARAGAASAAASAASSSASVTSSGARRTANAAGCAATSTCTATSTGGQPGSRQGSAATVATAPGTAASTYRCAASRSRRVAGA